MAEIIYADRDRIASIWLPFCENRCCIKWHIAQLQSNLRLLSTEQFTWCQIQQKLARDGKTVDHIDPEEWSRIQALFAQGDTVQVFVFELLAAQDASLPTGDELVFCLGCERKAYQVLPDPDNQPVCNKIDYTLNIFYDRVWLSSANVHHLNDLGLLEPTLYGYKCAYSPVSGETCYVTGWQVLSEPIRKIMYDAGWNPSASKLETICWTIAYLVLTFGNPTPIDQGCGLRFSWGTFVTDAIVAQY